MCLLFRNCRILCLSMNKRAQQKVIRCNRIEHCVQIYKYPPSTIDRCLKLQSTQRIRTHNSHRHNTTPPLQTLVLAPYPLLTYTTHTTVTQTQKHVQHSSYSHRIGKSLTQCSHPPTPSPLTPPREKHRNISHTPPTPLLSSHPIHHTHHYYVCCARHNT